MRIATTPEMKNRHRYLLFPLFAIVAALLLGAAVMFLWNGIVPGLTGWSTLTFPKAIGILLLCRILFGGFRGHGSRCGHGPHGWEHRAEWRKKWAGMTEEQRAELRDRWKHRCGTWAQGPSSPPSDPTRP